MTAKEMATEFVTNMNPERKTDGSANFGIYEFALPQDGVHLEVCFIEEDFPDDEIKFKTAIDVVGDSGEGTGVYTCVDTMTDIEAIESGIAYVLEEAEKRFGEDKREQTDGERGAEIIDELLKIIGGIMMAEQTRDKIRKKLYDLYECLNV